VVPLLAILALAAYAVAAFLFWADRSLRPLLLLFAGSIATLSQPLWARLFANNPVVPGNIIRFGESVVIPFWTVIGGGVLFALPVLFVLHGLRRRWWVQHYATAWGFFICFVLFFMIAEAMQARANLVLFARPLLPDGGLLETLLQSVLLAGVSFGLLYAFVSTRHYALQIALFPMLLSGLATSLLLFGVLCSPYWVARLLNQSDRILFAGAAVSLLLVLWAIHLLASGLHAGRTQRLQWR
jgi:hypothetical protein